jgi:hypothetical protein
MSTDTLPVCLLEKSAKEIYNDTSYIITIKKFATTFEISVEDEIKCLIWQKDFAQDYFTKLATRIGADLDLDAVFTYIQETLSSGEIRPTIDIMYGGTAKNLLEMNARKSQDLNTKSESTSPKCKIQIEVGNENPVNVSSEKILNVSIAKPDEDPEFRLAKLNLMGRSQEEF